MKAGHHRSSGQPGILLRALVCYEQLIPVAIISPTVLLYSFVVVTEAGQGFYFASGYEPPPAFILVIPLGFLWIIGWWLLVDSRKRGIAWVYDMG